MMGREAAILGLSGNSGKDSGDECAQLRYILGSVEKVGVAPDPK